jgi:signal transduction histidine kinase
MRSVEVTRTQTFAPVGGDGGLAPDAIVSAHALYVADEALSAVRHEVLNRMTAVGALSFEIRRALEQPPEQVRERLEDLNRQVGLVCEAVARRLAPPRNELPAKCAIRDLMEPLALLCAGPVELRTSVSRMQAGFDPLPLAVALLCVIENAVQACADERRPLVEVHWEAAGEDRLAVEVIDNGPGLNAEVETRAFERFFTTREGHAGLGLSVARTLLTRGRGEISLHNRSEEVGGTRVRIVVPAARRGRGEGR